MPRLSIGANYAMQVFSETTRRKECSSSAPMGHTHPTYGSKHIFLETDTTYDGRTGSNLRQKLCAKGILRLISEEEGYHFAAIREVVPDEDAERACLCSSLAGLGTMAPALALDT
jgi:hypothetical protein